MADIQTAKGRRGFASMTPEQRKSISSMGGKSVRKEARSFSRDNELARRAAKAGGLGVPSEKRTFSVDRAKAAEAGRKGGKVSHGKPRKPADPVEPVENSSAD